MLFGEFFTANICSMVLVIGNPVNLIVAQANGLSFAAYSSWMAAPAIVGSVTCCGLIYLIFRKEIDVTFTPPTLNPEACLKDKRGIAFHGFVLLMTRLFLGVSDNINAQNWVITTVAAFISFCYNLYFWPWDKPAAVKAESDMGQKENGIELQAYDKLRSPTGMPSMKEDFDQTPEKQALKLVNDESPESPVVLDVDVNAVTKEELPTPSQSPAGTTLTFDMDIDAIAAMKQKELEKTGGQEVDSNDDGIRVDEPTAKACILNCPWAVLPFVFGMFTLVNALKKAGWIDAFAQAILNVIPGDEGNSAHAIAVATFLMTTISFVLCTLIDNQPASILLTQVLLAPAFDSLPTMVRTSGMLGVLEGANVGGCWSLMGALAGIMWATLLRNKGIRIGYIQFMKNGLRVMPIVTFMIALIIFLESIGKA